MDKPKITPKDFFLWFGAMAFLYVSVFALIALIFSYLDYVYPDPLAYYSGDPYSGGISYYMAVLIVLFPLCIVLMRIVHKSIEADPSRRDLWIRRWALYLTLFVAGVTVAGDLITLIMYFFNGDVTMRFALKVLVVLLVAGAGFVHFLADLRDYWQQNPSKSRIVGYAAGALVLITIGAGFFIIGTPWQAREYRYDSERISHLQNIQSEIINYWRSKEVLPKQLENLNNSLSSFYLPTDPKTHEAYEYSVLSPLTFELCATFAAETQPYAVEQRSVPVKYPGEQGAPDNWHHMEGRTCFTRSIDRDLYPPYRENTAQ
jgi:hypothetical protein